MLVELVGQKGMTGFIPSGASERVPECVGRGPSTANTRSTLPRRPPLSPATQITQLPGPAWRTHA